MNFFSLIIFFLAQIVLNQANLPSLGLPCVKVNGLRGTCKLFDACPNAQIFVKKEVDLCKEDSKGNTVVCCTNSGSSNKSYENCLDYKYLTQEVVEAGALDLYSTPSLTLETQCPEELGLIHGGENAFIGEFPHAAALGKKEDGENKFECGGSLISERFILTAAHCSSSHLTFARLGYRDVTSTSADDRGKDYQIERFIKHEDYNSETLQNDIALAKLKDKVSFTDRIRPACLYYHSLVVSESTFVAIGWGQTSHGSNSEVLQKVKLNLVRDPKLCANMTNSRVILDKPMVLTIKQLCAIGGLGKDTCYGDSGGPLEVTKDDIPCLHYIAGVTSYGIQCGHDIPGVYARVYSYLKWIESRVWP